MSAEIPGRNPDIPGKPREFGRGILKRLLRGNDRHEQNTEATEFSFILKVGGESKAATGGITNLLTYVDETHFHPEIGEVTILTREDSYGKGRERASYVYETIDTTGGPQWRCTRVVVGDYGTKVSLIDPASQGPGMKRSVDAKAQGLPTPFILSPGEELITTHKAEPEELEAIYKNPQADTLAIGDKQLYYEVVLAAAA